MPETKRAIDSLDAATAALGEVGRQLQREKKRRLVAWVAVVFALFAMTGVLIEQGRTDSEICDSVKDGRAAVLDTVEYVIRLDGGIDSEDQAILDGLTAEIGPDTVEC